MKKLWLCVGLALLAAGADAQSNRTTLMYAYDLDGEAADDDQIVASADLLDSTTFTIAAQPDVCRLIDMTITDANSSITAGTVTVTGTDCLGYPRVCAFDFAVVATRGSGVKTIPVTTGPPASSCYLRDVTSIVSSALTGEGGAGVDLIKAGYTSNSANGWAMYGALKTPGGGGEHGVDPFASISVNKPITTSGSSSTTVTSVGSLGSFDVAAAGDLLLFNIGPTVYERKITARASANSITINQAVNIPAAGVTFRLKKLYFSTDPSDEMLIPVGNAVGIGLHWGVDANADTGGVVSLFECGTKTAGWPTTLWKTIDTTTTNSGSTGGDFESVTLTATPYTHCRFGVKFGTGDDTDTADENITAALTLRQQ